MKRINTAIVAITMLACSAAQADEWNGEDKNLHALGGGVIALAMTAQTGNAYTGFKYGCGAGVAKELFDATGQGEVSAKDLLITCLGASVGAGSGLILVPGAVLFKMKF